jgi:hypothetical protein
MDPNDQPGSLWNGEIVPLANMTIGGALWYQVGQRSFFSSTPLHVFFFALYCFNSCRDPHAFAAVGLQRQSGAVTTGFSYCWQINLLADIAASIILSRTS